MAPDLRWPCWVPPRGSHVRHQHGHSRNYPLPPDQCVCPSPFQLTDPYMSMFRGIIPAIGGIDLSPMLGFFLLNFLRGVLISMAV